MTLLVISPDYASHLLPLATLATAWTDAAENVVVATGPATEPLVHRFGFRRVDLPLGRGANAGVIRAEDQVAEEADSLAGFFAATRRGMVETLTYQARERLTDLMWDPVGRAQATRRVVEQVAPSAILVDHLAFGARLALHTAGIPYADVVLGHPTALPVGDEVYGYAPSWPSALSADAGSLEALRAICDEVSSRFTAQWNTAAAELDPGATPVADAFRLHGETVLYNYPAELAEGDERVLPPHVFLGSAQRVEPRDDEVESWLAVKEPFVYVSLGSFLSVRDDVLARLAEALRALHSATGIRAAIASGSTPIERLGPIPEGWLVREYLPQVRLLSHARAAVTHGGNNSVTEAVGQGVPLLVLPMSTDQFAGAAALERTGTGIAADPNAAGPDELRAALETLCADDFPGRASLAAITEGQRRAPGPRRAFEAVTGTTF
ncbi:glycosyltransferase [Microbacterium sp. NPDC077184]|uniref:glycosyltransferase n=1 Tax=Microbacterium sp. NPDC077184 TaxID=3154764 RepID=UPI00342DEC06